MWGAFFFGAGPSSSMFVRALSFPMSKLRVWPIFSYHWDRVPELHFRSWPALMVIHPSPITTVCRCTLPQIGPILRKSYSLNLPWTKYSLSTIKNFHPPFYGKSIFCHQGVRASSITMNAYNPLILANLAQYPLRIVNCDNLPWLEFVKNKCQGHCSEQN